MLYLESNRCLKYLLKDVCDYNKLFLQQTIKLYEKVARYGSELLDESDIHEMIFVLSNGELYNDFIHQGQPRRYSSVVEHFTRNEGVPGSSPGAAFYFFLSF